jgi:hypothetical protein
VYSPLIRIKALFSINSTPNLEVQNHAKVTPCHTCPLLVSDFAGTASEADNDEDPKRKGSNAKKSKVITPHDARPFLTARDAASHHRANARRAVLMTMFLICLLLHKTTTFWPAKISSQKKDRYCALLCSAVLSLLCTTFLTRIFAQKKSMFDLLGSGGGKGI